MSKGLAEVHLPNDKYRDGWERIFGGKNAGPEGIQGGRSGDRLGAGGDEDRREGVSPVDSRDA